MENIDGLVNILFDRGGTVVMAILFIAFLVLDRVDRKTKEKVDKEERAVKETDEKEERKKERESNDRLLSELSASNRNIAESLNLLKTSLDNTNNEFRQHDERAIKNFAHIKEDLIILKERK